MLSPNTILQNRYRIIRQLGQGGMGTVYEALDQRVNAIVALKETLVGESEESRRAFEREAGLLANLHNQALPKVMDYFMEAGGEFLVLEYISGYDLAELLAMRGTAFEVNQVLRWADELLKVLEYLHGLNPPVLHRDIKPSNLKLTKQGEIFLLDFGLAKGAAGQMSTMLTNRSVYGFTPVYAPLEQIHGKGTDPRSDLYSLGATLYHLLTAAPPLDAPTRFDTLEDDKPDPLRPIEELNPQVPPAIATLIHQAMAVSRRQRPASATQMRKALRHAEEEMRRAASAEEEARQRKEAERQREEERLKRLAEAERLRKEAEEKERQRQKAEKEAAQLANEERARQEAQAELSRLRAEAAERKRRLEEERQKRAEEEKRRQKEEDEARRKKAEEKERQKREAEKERALASAETASKFAEEIEERLEERSRQMLALKEQLEQTAEQAGRKQSERWQTDEQRIGLEEAFDKQIMGLSSIPIFFASRTLTSYFRPKRINRPLKLSDLYLQLLLHLILVLTLLVGVYLYYNITSSNQRPNGSQANATKNASSAPVQSMLANLLASNTPQAANNTSNTKQPETANSSNVNAGTSSADSRRKSIASIRAVNDGATIRITSDVPLNDYAAYWGGKRYYVVIPNAELLNPNLEAVQNSIKDRDCKIERRGNALVVSFSLAEGARARVEQKFNYLDVIFMKP